jgi:hypothetical protein
MLLSSDFLAKSAFEGHFLTFGEKTAKTAKIVRNPKEPL